METLRSLSTKEIANYIGLSERSTRERLAKLERRGLVKRVGERGGWIISRPEPIDLYRGLGGDMSNATPGGGERLPADETNE